MLGWIGGLTGFGLALDVVAVAILLASLVWHARGGLSFPGSREARQANRNLARSKTGLVYFGALLAAGLLTQMSTPLVYAGATLSLSYGLTWGALYGAAFGLGRSAPALLGPVLVRRKLDPVTVAGFVGTRLTGASRIVGVTASAVAILAVGIHGI